MAKINSYNNSPSTLITNYPNLIVKLIDKYSRKHAYAKMRQPICMLAKRWELPALFI